MPRVSRFSLLVLLVLTTAAESAVRHVRTEYLTIQEAISDSNDGDVVVVDPGVYYETINFSGKNIVLTSTDPNDLKIVNYTVIHAQQDGTAVTFDSNETNKAVLTGFTLTAGVGTTNPEFGTEIVWGGGIYCYRASPTITRNVISSNHVPFNIDTQVPAEMRISYGGGISCYQCSPIITNNIIKNNSAYIAGGILTYIGNARISNNVIYANSAYAGGGLAIVGGVVSNNTIVANDVTLGADQGVAGNVYVVFHPTLSRPRLFNNIVCNAPNGGGIFWEGEGDTQVLSFNNVWGNLPGNYTTVDPALGTYIFDGQISMTGHRGNISKDPLFAGPVRFDYHLKTGSPCINAGDPDYTPPPTDTDMDAGARIYARRIDIGADEYVGYIAPVAYAGPDQHILEPLQTVTLDGAGSYFYDPCAFMGFRWNQVSGPAVTLSDPNTAGPTFVPPSEGEYRFSLIVADESNTSSPDEVLVLVKGNLPPVADAGINTVGKSPGRITLDGAASYDPDPPDRLDYRWKQLKGPHVSLQDANSAAPYFECDTEGIYLFELVVSDGFTQSLPDVVQVAAVGLTMKSVSLNAATGVYAHYPDISGSKVVSSVGLQDDYSWGIVCKDIKTGQTETFGTDGIDTQPRIDGEVVVWAGGPSSSGVRKPENLSIFARNIPGAIQITLVTAKGTNSLSHPAISGNKVVWLRHPNADKTNLATWQNSLYDICGADITNLTNPVYFTVAVGVGTRDPYAYQNYATDFDHVIDICNNIVVWEANGDIYGADISNLGNIRVFAICSHPARQFDPAISGSLVVWTDQRNDKGDIYGADISDLAAIRELELVRAPGAQQQPAVDGCLLAYMQGEASEGAIQVSCLTRKYGLLAGLTEASYLYGTTPALDAESLVFVTNASYGTVQGLALELGYSIADGPVRNATSRKSYDYIQHALNTATAGDHIIASRAVYNEKLNFKGKRLLLTSADPNDPDVVAATVIAGDGALVTFATAEDANCILSGFTILGGGKGINCTGSAPRIERCVIKGSSGPGIRLSDQSDAKITECLIFGNAGAGVEMVAARTGRAVKHSAATLTNCVIAGNRQHGVFGGIPTITNCTIVQNLLEGALCVKPTITNSILYGNGAGKAGVQIESGFASVTYSDIERGWVGLGNIDRDPCFVDAGYWADAADPDVAVSPLKPDAVWVIGDYHLLSRGWRWDLYQQTWVWDDVTSPCIDAGNPGSSLRLEPTAVPDDPQRKWGRNIRIDMGAFGGTLQASIAPPGWVPLSDIDNDGVVDLRDFALLADKDLALSLATPLPTDLNRDGAVNCADLRLFVDYWLCEGP